MHILYQWLSARLQYLHYISNEDTAVLHRAIDMIYWITQTPLQDILEVNYGVFWEK